MRRTSILFLLATLLVASAVACEGLPAAEAKDGDPGDYCSQSPDRPYGWAFTDACRGHDECLALLPGVTLEDRLACDDTFLDDLLDAPHAAASIACREALICRILATVYHRFVRFFSGQAERFSGLNTGAPLDALKPYVIEPAAPDQAHT